MRNLLLLFVCLFLYVHHSFAQKEGYIYSKRGRIITDRTHMLIVCLKSFNKDRTDETAVKICECELDKIDGHFTDNQIGMATSSGRIDFTKLINNDTALKKEIEKCYTNSGKTILLQAEGAGNSYIPNCVKSIQKNTEKKLDSNKLVNFCKCQMEFIKSKKVSDAAFEAINNPNSILFYEFMYTCGNPYQVNDTIEKNWTTADIKDITGPSSDTIEFVALNGMTYLKAKTGSLVQFWLFDTGASDLLIGNEMEDKLKQENYISLNNYLGTAEYEMANGTIDTCRKYRINNFRIGKYYINNIVVAVSNKAKKIIIGRSLLNKFSSWILDNKKEVLILTK